MRNILVLLSICVALFLLGIYTDSPFTAMICVVLFATFSLPIIGAKLRQYAEDHSEYSYKNFKTGISVHRIGK